MFIKHTDPTMGVIDDMIPDYYYYIDPQAESFREPQPNPMENLIDVYGLNDIAEQVARFNEDGTRGVKLRKSYKNQISDVAGHWTSENIPTVEQHGDFQSKVYHYNNSVNPLNGQVDITRQDIQQDDSLFNVENINDFRQSINNFGSQRINTQEFNPNQLAFDFQGGVLGSRRKRNEGGFNNGMESNMNTGTVSGTLQNEGLRQVDESPNFKRRKLDGEGP